MPNTTVATFCGQKNIIGFDDPEDPQTLKMLIEATGATCLDYIDETECCGAPSVGVSDKVALSLARDKLNHVKDGGGSSVNHNLSILPHNV